MLKDYLMYVKATLSNTNLNTAQSTAYIKDNVNLLQVVKDFTNFLK